MALSQQLLYLWHTFRKYLAASALSFSLNLGLSAFFHQVLLFTEESAFAVTLVVIFTLNFVLVRNFVYADAKHATSMSRQFFLTVLCSISFRTFEYLGFLLLHTLLQVYYLVAIASVLVVSFILKFFVLRLFVFPPSSPAVPHA